MYFSSQQYVLHAVAISSCVSDTSSQEFMQTEVLWFVALLQVYYITRGTVLMPFFCNGLDSQFFSLTTSHVLIS
jgi:hypothetical protein